MSCRASRSMARGRRTDAAETVDGDLHRSLGGGVDGGGLRLEVGEGDGQRRGRVRARDPERGSLVSGR
jgi:hypothetical protein